MINLSHTGVITAKKVMIIFRVDRDSDARLSRSTINHSVGAGPGWGGWGGSSVKEGVAMGAVTVWQGDVS